MRIMPPIYVIKLIIQTKIKKIIYRIIPLIQTYKQPESQCQ